MIKTLEYAILSGHAYKPYKHSLAGIEFGQLDEQQLMRGWQSESKTGWYWISDVDSFVVPERGFFAALFVKFNQGLATDAVVAIRGTNSLANIAVDVRSWQSAVLGDSKFDKVPVYYIKAVSFFRKSRDYVKQYFPKARVTLTGHSLGGALAQLLVGLGHKPYTAVTFNSPGVGHIRSVDPNNAYYQCVIY